MIYFAAILMIIVNALFYVSRVPYTCQPYSPPTECETGLYQIRLYEQPTDRNPIAIADAHCIVSMSGRVRAEQVRFTTYSKYSREIIEVDWSESMEFPDKNLEACQIR